MPCRRKQCALSVTLDCPSFGLSVLPSTLSSVLATIFHSVFPSSTCLLLLSYWILPDANFMKLIPNVKNQNLQTEFEFGQQITYCSRVIHSASLYLWKLQYFSFSHSYSILLHLNFDNLLHKPKILQHGGTEFDLSVRHLLF